MKLWLLSFSLEWCHIQDASHVSFLLLPNFSYPILFREHTFLPPRLYLTCSQSLYYICSLIYFVDSINLSHLVFSLFCRLFCPAAMSSSAYSLILHHGNIRVGLAETCFAQTDRGIGMVDKRNWVCKIRFSFAKISIKFSLLIIALHYVRIMFSKNIIL